MAPEPVEVGDPAVFVEVDVTPDDVDLASGLAWAAGATGIEERDRPDGGVELVIGVPSAGGPEPVLAALGDRWPARVAIVDAREWDGLLDAWRDWARPWRVGRLVVEPPWAPMASSRRGPADVVLAIDPGRAFGSGAHPSTRLALGLLAEVLEGGGDAGPVPVDPGRADVIDVGCGSGVLAVAAARLGAARVVALDIDPESVRVTRENAAGNGVADQVLVVHGSASALGHERPGGTDGPVGAVVVANLLLPVQRELAADLERLAGAGPLVLAGILDRQLDALLACHPRHRAAVTRGDEGWSGVVLVPR